MKIKFLLPLIAVLASFLFSSCTPTQKRATTGAVAGAAIGAAVAGDGDRKKGAAVGAGVGAAAGAVSGQIAENKQQEELEQQQNYIGPAN